MKNPSTVKAFGARVRMLRVGKGLTQEELANDSNISWSTISRIERGNLSATVDVVASLAQALQLPLRDLFDFPLPS